MSLFKELKRRNVFRVAIAYAVATWLLLQIVDLVLENINAPDWVMQVFMLAMAVGFPIAIIIAWAFEVTPEGIKLEKHVDRSQSIVRQTGHQLNRGIIIILVMLVVLLLTDKFREGTFSNTEKSLQGSNDVASDVTDDAGQEVIADTNKSIAVLPFRDMSAAGDQAYFGEGIAEELLNALVKVDGLEVASRTSAFSLVDENLDIPTIAARLGVAHILEGSIRTSGQRVRVTAQLIEVNKDVHLWSETYDGSLDDIFKIQDEITAEIIEAMKVQLVGKTIVPTAAVLTQNAEAYQLYLQGRHFWRQRSSESLQRSIKLFRQAINLDPGFHRAWSNLAVAYKNLPYYDHSVSMHEYAALSVDAAEQALRINPDSSEALTVIADNYALECNSLDAAYVFQKAIEVNPKDPTARHWYAIFLMERGHINEALDQITLARKIDPLISAVISVEAILMELQGDLQGAALLARQAATLGIYQGSSYPEGMMEAQQGNFDRARQLMSAGLIDVDESQLAAIKLFIDAMEDPPKTADFERFINNEDEITANNFNIFNEMLAYLGSSLFFSYNENPNCSEITEVVWGERFRSQRGTPEYIDFMKNIGAIAYWREFGWPDDCASLDQTLAECE